MLCQLEPLDFLSSGESGGLAGPGKGEAAAQAQKKPRVKIAKRRRVVHPPPELIYLPGSATLKSLQEAMQSAFSSVYCMFSNFEVLCHSQKAPLLISRRVFLDSKTFIFVLNCLLKIEEQCMDLAMECNFFMRYMTNEKSRRWAVRAGCGTAGGLHSRPVCQEA